MNEVMNNLFEAIIDLLRKHSRIRFIVLSLCIPLFLITLVSWGFRYLLFAAWFNERMEQVWPFILVILGAVSLFALSALAPAKSSSSEVYKERIAEAESKVEAEPQKVRPAWDLARITLEAYFNRNLSQITAIFWLSVVVMMVGFVIIIWGIAGAFQSEESLISAAIATAAGIITEFIGATFLFVYRSTIQQGMSYSHTLERINAVGMAMQILDTMPDETKKDDLKSRTKATLVELLVRQANEASMLVGETEEAVK
jgi:hypothetical protein